MQVTGGKRRHRKKRAKREKRKYVKKTYWNVKKERKDRKGLN